MFLPEEAVWLVLSSRIRDNRRLEQAAFVDRAAAHTYTINFALRNAGIPDSEHVQGRGEILGYMAVWRDRARRGELTEVQQAFWDDLQGKQSLVHKMLHARVLLQAYGIRTMTYHLPVLADAKEAWPWYAEYESIGYDHFWKDGVS